LQHVIAGVGQDTITLLPECVTMRLGKPGVWMIEIAQNPPVSE
jgi:hypothetical protein